MQKQTLDLDLDDSDGELKINKQYASNYETWRKKEELQKFKDKYGTDNLDEIDDDSDSVSSVESVKWTAEDERDFLRTLGALKAKDPKIYQADLNFFKRTEQSDEERPSPKRKPKEKPMTLRDYEQKLVLERGGQLSDEGEDDERQGYSYTEHEAQLKQEFKNALNGFEANEDEDELLKKRIKTTEEQRKEEDEYYEWLKGHRQDVDNIDNDLKNLKKNWQKPELDEDEKFLRDYILNKQYETDANPSAISDDFCLNYEDILREEDDEIKRTEFEQKYNFRFEEPDQDFIKQFPRTVAESIRKPDTRRKAARERRKQRKEAEKCEREEEIRQLKKIQKEEMEKRLKKLKQMAGDDELPFDVDDLQKDFDPNEHDRKMKHLEEQSRDEKEAPSTSKADAKSATDLEFRYRQVEPNNYGLSTDEILNLDDRQLNAWVSMKKVTAYKSRNEEQVEQVVYHKKAQNSDRKKKLFASIPPKVTRSLKPVDNSKPPISSAPLNDLSSKKTRHRKRKSNMDLDANRLRSYGVSTQKLKSTLFKKKKKAAQ